MNRNWRTAATAVVLAIALLSNMAFAQSTNGAFEVTVTDPTGAHVPGAKVTVRNTSTNVSRTVETNSEGRANVAGLPIGSYEMTIEKDGFGKSIRSGLTLTINQNAAVAVQLKPQAAGETLTVTEDAPLLNTANAEVSVQFDQKRLQDLPTAGLGGLGGGMRDVWSFGLSVPGVSQINQGNTGFASGTDYSVNGARLRSNNFTLDGQDANDPSVAGVQQTFNNPEAVQEFRMLTNQFEAEFGRAAGSVVSVVTKSGTNNYHGSLFWFHNDNTLNSLSNAEKRGGFTEAPLRIENQIGGAYGGPINRDKTFFYTTYQKWTDRQLGAGSEITGAPTEAGRAQLQSIVTGRPQIAALLKFLPAAATATNNRFFCLGGPAPTVSGTGTSATATCSSGTLYTIPVGSITGSNRIRFDNTQWTLKIDHNINDRHNFSSRYLISDTESLGAGQATPSGLANVSPVRNQAATAGLTSSFTDRLLNELRVSWSRLSTQTQPEDPTALEIPSIEIVDLGLNGFNAVGTRTAIGYGVNLPQARTNNLYQLTNSTSWTSGNHTLKWGIDTRLQDVRSDFNPNIRGQLRYSTLHNYVRDVADLTAQINQPLPGGAEIVYYEWWDTFMFVQDRWKITPNFTLSLGLRYELPGNSVESIFGLNDNIVAANGNNELFRYTSRPPADRNNFQPRVGFNWNPQGSGGMFGWLTGDNDLVIRGGFSRTHDYAFLNMALNITSAFPFQAAYNIVCPATASCNTNSTANSYVNLQNQSLNLATARLLNQTRIRDDFRSPYSDQYSLELQREFGQNHVFRLGYVGTKGNGLFQSIEGNPVRQNCGAAGAIVTGCGRVDPTQGVIRVRANTGGSIYHSLQTGLERRFSRGLSGGVNYTWSAFIDDASEVFNPSSGEVATPQSPFSNAGERARSTYDRPHRVSGNVVWELPWMRTQAGVLGRILGGWQTGTVMTFQSGSPFTVLNGADPAGILAGSLVGNAIRPNLLVSADELRGLTVAEVLERCGPGSATGNQCWGRATNVGSSPRNILRSDGLVSVDVNVVKNFKIAESHQFQFRMDMFNMLNHRNFGIPDANISSTNFLNEKATDGGNRRIWLSMRYSF